MARKMILDAVSIVSSHRTSPSQQSVMQMNRYRRTMPTITSTPVSVISSPVKPRPKRSRFQITQEVFDVAPKRQPTSAMAEYTKYVSGVRDLENPDILHFWEVGKSITEWCDNSLSEKVNKAEFLTLYAMAMDYLPIQATSVPSERVFSSAKETDTLKRNRINPALMEALQLLKFSLKKERLNFISGWATSESEMRGDSVPGCDVLGTLLKAKDDKDAGLDVVLKGFLTDDEDDE
jgi:hypothetical protein